MTDQKPNQLPPQETAPLYTPIEWETPRPRSSKPSLLRRLWPSTSPSTGPSRAIPTTKPEPEPTDSTFPNTTSPSLPSRLNRILPPNRTYLRLPRTRFLILLLSLSLFFLLSLILGLSLGLRHHSSPSLPLPPTSTALYNGELTYYAPGLGACGWTSSAEDAIVAVSHLVFDAAAEKGNGNPNENPLCGKRIRVTRDQGNGKGNRSVDVAVVDRCTGCRAMDLDLSPRMFGELAGLEEGRVAGTWGWLV
ncbi:RlpA-like double-psi beta-barrel-protein domain-containing protein-containing protein [Coniochaeta sp. 2T2.1]|nr:RlpA-like double-psi beta-barrel-protein domain-containing protein-containing protein [Coniochaeta sp. 2T2.1]